MAKGMLRDKRAVSPVIATVILVAVTIVVAIAVAYWMGGIAGLYTRFEKLQIQSAFATPVANFTSGTFFNSTGWNVTIDVKNAGTADATIEYVVVNGKPSTSYTQVAIDGTLPTIKIGETKTVVIRVKAGSAEGFTAGTSVDLKLHSAAGLDYTQLLSLP